MVLVQQLLLLVLEIVVPYHLTLSLVIGERVGCRIL